MSRGLPKAYKAIMKQWGTELWGWVGGGGGGCLTNPATPGSTGKIFLSDVHCAQHDSEKLVGKRLH